MEESQTALIDRRDTGPYMKLLPDKDLYNCGTKQDESSYVELDNLLDMKSESTKALKVMLTGENNQLAIFNNKKDKSILEDKSPGECELNLANLPSKDCECNRNDHSGDVTTETCVAREISFESVSPSDVPNSIDDFTDSPVCPDAMTGPMTEILLLNCKAKDESSEMEELQYTDIYLNKTSESGDCVNVVLSDSDATGSTEDESHFITTHEIQLTELDHDVDCDFELESCWDVEDDNLVYSFVDYASFDSDETIGADAEDDISLAPVNSDQALSDNTAPCPESAPPVSTKPENDLCDLDKRGSSDESLSKTFQNGNGNSAGQIHLSIKTTSRAINKSGKVKETENISYHANEEGDWSRYVFKHKEGKADGTFDKANFFIPAPGRVHFGRKLKGKDFDYSSGASSSVSELDDADKEVRNLTARAFKSIALPYFDAINLRASSDSSVSEHGVGVNSWSAFVDLKYGNMTQKGEKKVFSHKTSTFETNKNAFGKGINGFTQSKLNSTQTKLFAVNGGLSKAPQPSSNSKTGQGQNGSITLTETVNFSCNVKAGVPQNERRAKFAEIGGGSRSLDEVTTALPNEQGTEKKAMFASSLLKNVISKKMQFEHERKMERGEIRDKLSEQPACNLPKEPEDMAMARDKLSEQPACNLPKEPEDTARESQDLQKQNPNNSEMGSGVAPSSMEEPKETAQGTSGDNKIKSVRAEDRPSLAPSKNLGGRKETLSEAKKDSQEAGKGLLLPSQNSAFRSWKNGESALSNGPKSNTEPKGKALSTDSCNTGEINIDLKTGSSKYTKMSQLFVSNIQPQKEGLEPGRQGPKGKSCVSAGQGERAGGKVSAGTKPEVANAAKMSRSPEIKISLRTVKDNKAKPFNIANLLTPNIGFNAANHIRAGDSSRSQALIASLKGEWSDRMPHFMVRDIRDNKYKLLTPIHQVRDVRKLVKSSYHFLSLDNQENKSGLSLNGDTRGPKQGPDRKTMSLFSPMVIKCQSVNTNSRPDVKQIGHLPEPYKPRVAEETPEAERCSPPQPTDGTKTGTAPAPRSAARAPPLPSAKQPNGDVSETAVGAKKLQKQESVADGGEKKPESKVANQAAFEKLQAAVKTMEQLYVFNRNEWKRKNKAPQPIADSHVLSLITREEHSDEPSDPAVSTATGIDSYPSTGKSPPAPLIEVTSEGAPKKEGNVFLRSGITSGGREGKYAPKTQQSNIFANKNVFTLGTGQKAVANASVTSNKAPQPYTATPAHSGMKSFAPKSVKLPLSLKISQPKCAAGEREGNVANSTEAERSPLGQPGVTLNGTDSGGSYLAIPVSGQTNADKPSAIDAPAQEQATGTGSRATSSPATKLPGPTTPPAATVYHHPLVTAGQPQVICFPQAPPAPATPSSDPAQQTQRKMLLDPTTGQYYLVDTPVSPATRKLFDPETGHYLDVPAPPQPATPVPLPLSPLSPLATLSPGPYGSPTFVIYPGYLPSPPAAGAPANARTLRPAHSDGGSGSSSEGKVPDSPLYSPAGRSPLQSHHLASRGPPRGTPENKPVISITSQQQGPRIVAPPSFDGTTMSFVVEHR